MEVPASGLHHLTAVTADPRANAGFYSRVLGLRLVKRTVNFDDPSAYHLYYGDASGTPGTLLTFFHWPGAARGRVGTGQVAGIQLSTGGDSLDFWADRLRAAGCPAGIERWLRPGRWADPRFSARPPPRIPEASLERP